MNILVTGAEGFLGSEIVKVLKKKKFWYLGLQSIKNAVKIII